MVPQRAQLVQTDAALLPVSTLELLGDRMSALILLALSSGTLRFGALAARVGGSTKTVASRLKRLETQGIVTRTLYAQVPPRADYALTDKGRELVAILGGIAEWDRSWNPAQ